MARCFSKALLRVDAVFTPAIDKGTCGIRRVTGSAKMMAIAEFLALELAVLGVLYALYKAA